jgi:hypothetical protein
LRTPASAASQPSSSSRCGPSPVSPALIPSFRGNRDGRVRLPPRRPRYFSGRCRAMVQTFQGGPAASYAQEMERLSAKESLLLAVSPPSLSSRLFSVSCPGALPDLPMMFEPPSPLVKMIGEFLRIILPLLSK